MGRHEQLGQMLYNRTGLDTLALWSFLVLRAHIERAYQRTTCLPFHELDNFAVVAPCDSFHCDSQAGTR